MNRLHAALLVGVLGLLPIGTYAEPNTVGYWRKSCQSSSDTTPRRMSLSAWQRACWVPTTNANDSSPVLSLSDCDQVDAAWVDDTNGDGAASTVVMQWEFCPTDLDGTLFTGTNNHNDSALADACFRASDTSTFSANQAYYGLGIPTGLLRIAGTDSGSNPTRGHAEVKCNFGSP